MGALKQLRPSAFVSGASAGLGHEFAAMLLQEGVRVWGSSRDPSRLGRLAAAYPEAFFPVALDLADGPSALSAFSAAAEAASGSFDLMVNNAGYGVFGEFDALESKVWRSQLNDMLGSVTELSHAAYRRMQNRKRGCLVHVSSLAAEFPIPYMSGYNVAKAGLSALSESLMFESRGTEIRIIDFRPGDYRTNFNQAMQPDTLTQRARHAWTSLDAMFSSAPAPQKAARDLRRALLSNRSGIVRSGSFFQATLSPLFARLMPDSLKRAVSARYFGV